MNQQVCESIEHAAAFTDHNHPEAALAVLKDLPTDATVDPGLVALMRSQRIRAQRVAVMQNAANPDPLAPMWAGILSKGTTLLSWLITLGLAGLGLLALSQLFRLRRPLPRTLLSFVDQTGATPSEAANIALTQEANRLLNPSGKSSAEELLQPRAPSGSGATFVNLQPIWGASSIETALGSAADVDLGVFKISPKALIQAWKEATRPNYLYCLRGVLSKTEDSTFVYAQLLDKNRRPIAGSEWSAKGQGTNARDSALREVIAQFTIAHSPHGNSTKIWQSLDFFQQAMDHCLANQSSATLCESQVLLQQSLTADPSNGIARYNNALFLQMTGNYTAALQNWTFLIGRKHAGVPWVEANYNRLLTLARVGEWDEIKESISGLEKMVESETGKMEFLAKSALASALSIFYGKLLESTRASLSVQTHQSKLKPAQQGGPVKSPAPETGTPSLSAQSEPSLLLKQTSARIDQITTELIKSLETLHPVTRSLVLANATARNARGTVLFDSGRYTDALEDFNQAIMLNPALVDAHLNAADTVRKQRRLDWSLNAERYLKTALQLDPLNRQTHFSLGILYADKAVFRLSDAAEEFEKADPNSWASFNLAGLFRNPSFGVPNTQKALESLRKSVRLGDALDIRALDLVRLLITVVEQKSLYLEASGSAAPDHAELSDYDCLGLLSEADQIATRIIRRSTVKEDVAKAGPLQMHIKVLLQQLQTPASQPTQKTTTLSTIAEPPQI